MLALGHRALHLALVELLLGVLDVAPDALNLACERCALYGQVPQLLLVALSVQQARLQVPAQVPLRALLFAYKLSLLVINFCCSF